MTMVAPPPLRLRHRSPLGAPPSSLHHSIPKLFLPESLRASSALIHSQRNRLHHRLLLQSATIIAGSSDVGEPDGHLPAFRSYQNDLFHLNLIGAVSSKQALIAAAADGGDAADQHLEVGSHSMVVETVLPGSSGDSSTISTRLFLLAEKVKEQSAKLKRNFTSDVLAGSGASSNNILALTFRQVVLHTLWSFELSAYSAWCVRNMRDLADTEEVETLFTVSSSDKRFLSALAEVICSRSLEDARMEHLQNVEGSSFTDHFDWWFKTPQIISSVDSSICLYRISEGEKMNNVKMQMESFNQIKGNTRLGDWRPMKWWHLANLNFLKHDKLSKPHFSYKLRIDANKFINIKLKRWLELGNNKWEVLLTHTQMVELENIVDMYYEDEFTLPDKVLSCNYITEFSKISNRKASWNSVFFVFIGAAILICIGILSQMCSLHLKKSTTSMGLQSISTMPSIGYCGESLSFQESEMETFCKSVVKKIKAASGWPGVVVLDRNNGAWTGNLPTFLSLKDGSACFPKENSLTRSADDTSAPVAFLDNSDSSEKNASQDMQAYSKDIASYQVVLSRENEEVIGFQPMNRVAVNNWASNPLAKDLYRGRKLYPGLLEPGLGKIPRPGGVACLELLMSTDPNSFFALARPLRMDLPERHAEEEEYVAKQVHIQGQRDQTITVQRMSSPVDLEGAQIVQKI